MSANDKANQADTYQTESFLAEGSRARVYLASDRANPGKKFVIKFLREDECADNDEALKQIKHEAECLAAHAKVFVHTNVNEAGRPYLVTDFIEGKSLKRIFEEKELERKAAGDKPITDKQALQNAATLINMLLPLTNTLDTMHKVGVLHLDLRPDKIIFEPNGKELVPRLIGFGRAKWLPWAGKEQSVEPLPKADLYAIQYSSPEQAMDKRCLPTSDYYSFACIIFQGLTGKAPFDGENALHLMAQHLRAPIPLVSETSGIPALKKFDDIMVQCLAKEPHKRFVDGAEFKLAFSDLIKEPQGWAAKLFKRG